MSKDGDSIKKIDKERKKAGTGQTSGTTSNDSKH
jgi:hypothetical protein